MYYPFNTYSWIQFNNILLKISASIFRRILVSMLFSLMSLPGFGIGKIWLYKMCWERFPPPPFSGSISVGLVIDIIYSLST